LLTIEKDPGWLDICGSVRRKVREVMFQPKIEMPQTHKQCCVFEMEPTAESKRDIYVHLGKAFDAMVTKAAQSVVCAMDISSIVLRSRVTYSPLSPISKLRLLTASATASPGLTSCKI